MKTKKLTTMALLCAIALTIFMVEAQIPSPVPLPGVKLGLSNIVTVFAVFVMGPVEAILILAQDPEQTVTKELYPAVAARCGCASINVERAIRSAIESAWKKRDERVWQQYFPPAGDGACRRPTNAEFLNRIADCLALSGNVEG